jgi:hypothetical protein
VKFFGAKNKMKVFKTYTFILKHAFVHIYKRQNVIIAYSQNIHSTQILKKMEGEKKHFS